MNLTELKEIIQSANLNFLFGSGLSRPYLPILQDIEKRLTAESDPSKRIPIYKEYFENVIVPNFDIVDGSVPRTAGSDFDKTFNSYKKFYELLTQILLNRKSTILSKQVNIFTTNIDVFNEVALEDSSIEYNDGFSGHMTPAYSVSNFKKSIFKRSLHFDNISEIPVFNLIKIHGSLTWNKKNGEIIYSNLSHFPKTLSAEDDAVFIDGYEKIAIVNPEPKKLEETVIDLIYYDLLRVYSSELEKENSVLFVMGFSMADEHIKEITIRSANSNPTLKIYIFCYSNSEIATMKLRMKSDKLKYNNIEILGPEDDDVANGYTFEKINETVFTDIFKKTTHTDSNVS